MLPRPSRTVYSDLLPGGSHSHAAGIDLHGTLLDRHWKVDVGSLNRLTRSLESLRDRCLLFICSGNDLSFLHRHLTDAMMSLFDGYVLETGCVVSDGTVEQVLVSPDSAASIRTIEDILRGHGFPEVRYFAPRRATVSLFTRTAEGGSDPAELMPRVVEAVEESGFGERVYVTHSDVAVDVIPRGYDKLSGLRAAAGSLRTIGIADSLNDLPLITGADLAFLPANASVALESALESAGRTVHALGEGVPPGREVVLKSGSESTGAVVEILEFLFEYLGQERGSVGDDAVDSQSE